MLRQLSDGRTSVAPRSYVTAPGRRHHGQQHPLQSAAPGTPDDQTPKVSPVRDLTCGSARRQMMHSAQNDPRLGVMEDLANARPC
jgi:hypothetical protein